MRHKNVRTSESHKSKIQRFPDSWISITNVVDPDGAKQIILLNVLRVEGVIGPQGRIDHFYARLGEVEQDVDILFALFPIGNPIREKKKSMKNISRVNTTKNHPDTIKIRKRDKQRIKRLLKADIWKINIHIHVKSSVVTQSEEGAVLEHLQKSHKDHVLKVIGAWNSEFRPSKLKGITPRRLSDLIPSTNGQTFTYGDTRTIIQLTKFPQRMDTTPTPAFEVPPGLPTDIVLGKAMVGRREVEPVGLPLEALQNNVAIFTVDLDQRKRILTKILTQVQQYEQSCLILDTSGNYSINKPGNIVLRPGVNFHIAPLFTEGLSTEQYTDLFLRALNLYCELPESRLGELAGLLLTLYEDMGEQTSLQVLYRALLGEHSDDESTISSASFYYDTYSLRSVAALLHPLLHGLAGATVSADPNKSTIKTLEALLEEGNTVIIDLSRQFTPVFKKFFITLIISKLLAFRRSQLDNGLSSKDLILVLEDIDLFLRKGDWRTNQRLDNYLPVLIELGRVNVGLITLGTAPEVLWEPAWGVFSRSLIISTLSPDAARFIEKYLNLGNKRYDKTQRKFLQQLGANDIILVKRYDYVEPFLCKLEYEEVTIEQHPIVPVEVVQTLEDDQKLLSQAYDLQKIFAADSKHATNVLEILEARGKPVPYLGLVTMQEPGIEGGALGQEALKELLNRLEESGLIKFETSRGISAEMSIEITPVGRLFLQKHHVKTHLPSFSTEIKHAPSSQGEISTADEKTSIDLVKTSEIELRPTIEHPEFISRTRTRAKDWIAAKQQFWEEKPTAWAYMKTAILEALSDLYTTEKHHPPKSTEELFHWIRLVPDIDEYIYPELEEALLSPGNGPFDPNVFTSDILQMYEDLFSVSSYPRVIRRTAEIETLVKTQPIEAMKRAVSLITDLLSVIVDLDHIPPVDNFASFLEAFSLAGAFLPNKKRLRELEAIMGQINQGDTSQELAEKSANTLKNFNTNVKDLEAAIFDINEQAVDQVRRIYTQLVQDDVPKAKVSPEDLQESLIEFEEEDEVLSDLLAVGSEELVLIDCGRFIREGLGALLKLNMEQINLDYAKSLLTQILNDPTLKIPFVKPAKRVLDALSFLIETGELPAEDIAKLAQIAQKFAQTMKTYTPDQTVKAKLMKLFEMIQESGTEP
ncbi:MAG: hypothetical protein ACE5I5_10715 [Candidatus Heimdallarchaeota archaeon]